MKLPLHRSLKSPIILRALRLLGLGFWCAYQQYQIYDLNSKLAGSVSQDTIGSLIKRLNAVDDRLDQNSTVQPVSMADFQSVQQALSNRLDTMHLLINHTQDATRDDSHTAVSRLDMVALEAKFEGLQTNFQDVAKGRSPCAQHN